VLAGDIIYHNGVPSLQNAYHSDFDTSNPSDTVIVGDDFIFASAQVIRDVHWWGVYAFDNVPPAQDDFTIQFYNTNGGVPNNSPFVSFNVGNAVNRTDSGDDISGFDQYFYSAVIPDVPLAVGQYFIAIINNTVGTTADWFWSVSAEGTGNSWERDSSTAPWVQDNNEYAFFLTDTIPAPSAMAVLAVGLTLAGRRRRN
jgi:hypothetical protein